MAVRGGVPGWHTWSAATVYRDKQYYVVMKSRGKRPRAVFGKLDHDGPITGRNSPWATDSNNNNSERVLDLARAVAIPRRGKGKKKMTNAFRSVRIF